MKNTNAQILNTVLIVVGAVILIFGMSQADDSPFPKIIGLIILMIGLYRATQYWSATKDDHKQDQNELDQ